MRVVLKASDVAAIIGRNPYKPISEVRDELWKKYNPDTFMGRTRLDKAMEALAISEGARAVLDEAAAVRTKDSSEAVAVFTKAEAAVKADPLLNAVQKAEVIDHLRSKVWTGHGTRSEDKTSDKVSADTGARFVRDDSFYTYEVCVLDGIKFVVCGKIDRIEERPDGSKVLVEIKNRTRGLFREVRDYEMIQVQVYLQLLGLVQARLIEQHNTQVMSHDIVRDEELWKNVIVPGLENFCQELHSLWTIT
jgi:hypothetical protein